MDTSILAARRDKIATVLKDLRSLESRNEEQETLLKELLPFENETDENILAISEERWKRVFPENEESSEKPEGNDAGTNSDNESEADFEPPADRPSSQKTAKPTRRQRVDTPESEASEDEETDESVTIDEEALSGFGTDVKTDCITVGKTTKDVYINAYGRKGARIYKIEDQPDCDCDVDELPVINGHKKQLGMLIYEDTGKYKYTRRHVAAVYGIAFQDDIENGVYGPSSLDPAEKGDRRWADMYVWIGWRDPNNSKKVTRSWETRTTARRLWRKKTDMMLYLAAWEADKRYNDSGVRATSRKVTPSLIQNYIRQQREESLEVDIPRQPSVSRESIMPSIETSGTQNQPQRVSIRKQPQQASRVSSNPPTAQEKLTEILQSLQQMLSQMRISTRI
ncbi:hypothetical protein ACKLNR_015153 [Fusarium oxysporum f. sp. zingiberi]